MPQRLEKYEDFNRASRNAFVILSGVLTVFFIATIIRGRPEYFEGLFALSLMVLAYVHHLRWRRKLLIGTDQHAPVSQVPSPPTPRLETLPRDPWTRIRWVRRVFYCLPLVLILTLMLHPVLFPRVPFDQFMDRASITWVSAGWVLILFPVPCPRCGKTFWIFSFPNWGYWYWIQMKNIFNPIGFIAASFTSPCPHCKLPFGGDPTAVIEPPTGS